VCINAAYQLGPKHRFPAAPKSAWDVLKWAAANAKSFGADPSLGFVVGGTSSGGTLTAVLTHLARDEGLSPPLTGQYLAIPLLVTPAVIPEKYKKLYLSYEQNKNAPVLPQAAIDMFTKAYQPDEHDPLYAPFNHPNGHADLPPAYFQVCGLDLLRDDALIYERVLREEYGIKTKLDIYPGLPHGFGASFPMLKSADKFRRDMVEGIGWLLGRKPEMNKIRNSVNRIRDYRSKM
jgi:acetyl esterase/lipase